MKLLIDRLNDIANKNGDRFTYELTVDIKSLMRGESRYVFSTYESADGHCFLKSSGNSVEDVISKAILLIEESCESWGYEI